MKRLIIATFLWAIVLALGVWDYYLIKFPPCHLPKIYQEVLMPVVKIRAGNSIGSGVIIDLECINCVNAATTQSLHSIFILTAAHVVGDEDTVQVIMYSYRRDAEFAEILKATVIITDTIKDLALLHTPNLSPAFGEAPAPKGAAHKSEPRPYGREARPSGRRPYGRQEGNNSPLKRGGWGCVAKLAPKDYKPYLFTEVYAVGCSLGLPPRPSEGILSASAVNYWEISAPILPGNSGGGVFLKDTHELIGITVWIRLCHGQLVTTMAGIVPLNQIYEFLENQDIRISGYQTTPGVNSEEDGSDYQSIRISDKTPLMNCEEHKSVPNEVAPRRRNIGIPMCDPQRVAPFGKGKPVGQAGVSSAQSGQGGRRANLTKERG